ncbi:MAG: hypothetical protein BWY50_02086 [Spirochaetes bacterium ADurb.Bin315]|nr:MAG: hypothetical protein BWY50_02086 [Spirochaetes bacterium ADurb.Bin315]
MFFSLRLSPILQGEIERSRTEVAAADSDLHDVGNGLPGGKKEGLGANLFAERSDFGKLLLVELSFVFSIYHDVLSDLPPGKVVENQALFAGVHHRPVEKNLVLLGKLELIAQRLEVFEDLFGYRHRGVVVGDASGGWDGACLNPFFREQILAADLWRTFKRFECACFGEVDVLH